MYIYIYTYIYIYIYIYTYIYIYIYIDIYIYIYIYIYTYARTGEPRARLIMKPYARAIGASALRARRLTPDPRGKGPV